MLQKYSATKLNKSKFMTKICILKWAYFVYPDSVRDGLFCAISDNRIKKKWATIYRKQKMKNTGKFNMKQIWLICEQNKSESVIIEKHLALLFAQRQLLWPSHYRPYWGSDWLSERDQKCRKRRFYDQSSTFNRLLTLS